MAMDNFKEEIVVKRHQGLANFTYYLSWTMMIVFALIGVFMVQMALQSIGGEGGFAWGGLIISLVFLGLAVLIWWKKDTLRVEYEYTFTNGTLDVSMVLNNSKRRYLTELQLKTVESAGLVTHASFNRYLSDKSIKKHNWFLNRDNNLVYFFFSKNNQKHLMVIEPSEEMLGMIRSRNYLGFSVWQN